MNERLGMFPLDRSTPSLRRVEPTLGGAPAPAGTVFVLSEDGGYAATPHEPNRLTLGRDIGRVHVVVGANDSGVSREHATLWCMTRGGASWWTLHNIGRRPIELSEAPPLLRDQQTALEPGPTTLYVRGERIHAVEVLVSLGPRIQAAARPDAHTRDGRMPLSDRERLVLVAMFQDYLERSRCAYPLTRNDTSRALNEVPGQSDWTPRKVENVVAEVRKRLAGAGADGYTEESAHPEMLRINLVHHLLATASLVPDDLGLLNGPPR